MAKYTASKIIELSKKIVGTKINRLTILEYLGVQNGKSRIKTKCECGIISIKMMHLVLRGTIKSCGCLTKEVSTIHGLRKHPLYNIWYAMIKRCEDENDKSYKNYGGSGVIVCNEWRNSFIVFYTWAINNGWEQGLQLDKDINGNGKLYSPLTCAFVTRKENNRNTRNNVFITFGGRKATMKEWSEITGIPYGPLIRRLIKGRWPIEKALTEPFKPYARC